MSVDEAMKYSIDLLIKHSKTYVVPAVSYTLNNSYRVEIDFLQSKP
jgi:hypothetical protein